MPEFDVNILESTSGWQPSSSPGNSLCTISKQHFVVCLSLVTGALFTPDVRRVFSAINLPFLLALFTIHR